MTQPTDPSPSPGDRPRRRRPGALALILAVTLGMGGFTVLVGLFLIDWPDDDGLDRWAVIQLDPNAPFLPTLANADVGVGPNRLSFTVQDERGRIRPDLTVRVALYDLAADPNVPVLAQFAQFISFAAESPLPVPHQHAAGASLSDNARYVGAGIYVVPAYFPRGGTWGIEFAIAPADEPFDEDEAEIVLFRLAVREQRAAPVAGDAALATPSRTLLDEPDLGRLTSDPRPEPGLYQLSIDDALANGRPLLLVFATPAFCHSRTCAPTLDVVKAVWRDHAADLDAIHVEVFENPHEPSALAESAAFLAWDLPSEPWVFLMGTIVAAYEGSVTDRELRRGEARRAVAGRAPRLAHPPGRRDTWPTRAAVEVRADRGGSMSTRSPSTASWRSRRRSSTWRMPASWSRARTRPHLGDSARPARRADSERRPSGDTAPSPRGSKRSRRRALVPASSGLGRFGTSPWWRLRRSSPHRFQITVGHSDGQCAAAGFESSGR